jgi:phosphoserine aminotransferase
VENKNARSLTVISVEGEEKLIQQIKSKAKKEGLLLGNGYGKWSKNTFRIANFPAIKDKEINKLQSFLKATVK